MFIIGFKILGLVSQFPLCFSDGAGVPPKVQLSGMWSCHSARIWLVLGFGQSSDPLHEPHALMWRQHIQLTSPSTANNKSDTKLPVFTMSQILCWLPPLILSTALWKRYCYCLHFNNKELRPGEVQWLISHGLERRLPGLTLSATCIASKSPMTATRGCWEWGCSLWQRPALWILDAPALHYSSRTQG